MPQNNPRRLSEILGSLAPQGANDKRWALIEHQLAQAKMSLQTVVGSLRIIADKPENEGERIIAKECMTICKDMFSDFSEYLADFERHVAGTDVPERISRKEL